MKIKYIVLAVMALGFTGCDKFLDEVPDSRIEVDTKEKIQLLLVSAYPSSHPMMGFELMSDNHEDNGSQYASNADLIADYYLFKEDASSISQDSPYYLWESFYGAVATANLALESIEMLENPEEAEAEKGEALLCRAFGHFLAVQTFCQAYNTLTSDTDLGVPYSTLSEVTVHEKYDRSNVAEVYRNILADIEAGIPLLDDSNYKVPKYHFTRKAAYAFAAEVYLYYGDYDRAIEYATKALGDNPKGVLRNHVPLSNATSNSDAHLAYITPDEQANLLILPCMSNWGRYMVGSPNYNRYGHTLAICTNGTYRSSGPWAAKGSSYLAGFKNWNRTGYSTQYVYSGLVNYIFETTDEATNTGYYHTTIPVFSTDKAILVRAEAYVMKQQYELAAQDLSWWIEAKDCNPGNEYVLQDFLDYYSTADEEWIRQPLNPRGITFADETQLTMLYAVLHARRIETQGQGWRFIDLKRYGIGYVKYVYNATDITLEPWDLRLAVQIPSGVYGSGMQKNPR